MRAYVLCGGFGTRLRSVIRDSQKAMVQVHGEPFLARVLQQLAAAGIEEAVLCAHYRAEQIAEQLDALATDAGMALHMVVEAQPLGTGGALLNALRERPVRERYLALNADTFLEAHAYRLAAEAAGNALVASRVDDRSRYGSLAVNPDGLLVALQEKGLTGPGLINAGVYAFTPEAFAASPVHACSLEQALLPRLLARAPVAVVEYAGPFIDIGTPESLDRYTNVFQTVPPR